MRWLTLLLVVLNLVIFGWYWNLHQQQQAQEKLSRQLPEAPRLRLLTELETAPVVRPPKPALVVPDQGASTLPAESSSAVSGGALSIDKASKQNVAEDGVKSLAEMAGEVSPLALPVEVVECYRLGPFDTEKEARRRVASAELLALQPEVEQLGIDHRVVVTVPGGVEQIKQSRRSLAAMGLETFVLSAEGATGVLSLGVFRSPERAEALVGLLAGRQYTAEVQQEVRNRVRYLADIRLVSRPDQSPEWLVKLTEKQPVMKIEKKVCQGLASLNLPE